MQIKGEQLAAHLEEVPVGLLEDPLETGHGRLEGGGVRDEPANTERLEAGSVAVLGPPARRHLGDAFADARGLRRAVRGHQPGNRGVDRRSRQGRAGRLGDEQ